MKINCIYWNKQTKECDCKDRKIKDFNWCYLYYDPDSICKHQIKPGFEELVHNRTGVIKDFEDTLLAEVGKDLRI